MKTIAEYCFLWILLSVALEGKTQCNCDHTISPTATLFDGGTEGVMPGDIICLNGGTHNYLRLRNITGSVSDPVIIKNCNGQVIMNGQYWWVMAIERCTFFRLTGTGDPNHENGIVLQNSEVMGIQTVSFCTDMEFDHLEIRNVGFAGISSKTDPSCSNPDVSHFTQYNTIIHDNYIHDIGGEGLYIGYFTYPTRTIDCDGQSTILKPHPLENVQIYNNRLVNTGWDAIQVGSAPKGVRIFDNYIENYATANELYQQSGIQFNGGSSGIIERNFINGGSGPGMAIFGIGDAIVQNNIIVDAGENGVYLTDRDMDSENYDYYRCINNTIINPAKAGIRTYITQLDASVVKCNNNLVVSPGTDMVAGSLSNTDFDSCMLFHSVAAVGFVDAANGFYGLQSNAAVVDKGKDVSDLGLSTDYAQHPRPTGNQFDVGAYEYFNIPCASHYTGAASLQGSITANAQYQTSGSLHSAQQIAGANILTWYQAQQSIEFLQNFSISTGNQLIVQIQACIP